MNDRCAAQTKFPVHRNCLLAYASKARSTSLGQNSGSVVEWAGYVLGAEL